MSERISEPPCGRIVSSVPIEPQTRELAAIMPGLFWVFGDNPKGPLYFHRISDHCYPAPAIQEIRRMPHADISRLMAELRKVIEKYENEPEVIHKRSGDIVAVSAEIADVQPIVAGCFDVDMSGEVSALQKDTVQPPGTSEDKLTLWQYRRTDPNFLATEQDAAEEAIVSLEEILQVPSASKTLLRDCFCHASYAMTGADNLRAVFEDIVRRVKKETSKVTAKDEEHAHTQSFVTKYVGA
jgi:GTPase SAR1 family protein